MRRLSFVSIVLLLTLILPAQAQSDSRYFAETAHTVKGRFLQYWNTHGGLQQQGYPISSEMQEVSELDGKSYTVQYFERAEFELHPENQPPNDVLLAQLGTFRLKEKYAGKTLSTGKDGGSGQYFPQTGHSIDGRFLSYWQANGGLQQQGYPISERMREVSDLDGKEYTVQYFERAVLELHSDNQPPNDVLLSQLGTFRYKEKHETPATATPEPTAIASPTPLKTPPPAAASATPTLPSDPSLVPGVYIAQPQLKRGSYQTITITAKAGANVSVVCTYPSGDKTSNGCSKLFKDGPKVPDDKGHVVVHWRVGSTTHPGKVIVNVTVEMNGAQGTAQTSFDII